jgi:hypothetical protein
LFPTKILFICYINRSGSTYLANLFSKSPDICVCPESDTLVDLFLVKPVDKPIISSIIKLKHAVKNEPKLHAWQLPEDITNSLPMESSNFDCFLYLVKAYQKRVKPGSKIIVFKAERLIELYEAYSVELGGRYNLNWIAIVRDCRAVYNSQKRTLFPGSQKRMSASPIKTALKWRRFINRSLKYSTHPDFFWVQYEKLVANLKNEFNSLLSSLAIQFYDFTTAAGDLWNRLPDSHRLIHSMIDGPPNTKSLERWKTELTNRDIRLIQYRTKNNLQMLGYPLMYFSNRTLWIAIIALFQILLYYIFIFFRKAIYKFKLCTPFLR